MGFAVALCAPSGAGKTTVARSLVESSDDLIFSISATTRAPRHDEVNGVDYHFLGADQFEAMVAEGAFLEWANVHGELYGTPRANLDEAEREGKVLILDIDVQGAGQVVEKRPDTVTIFLLPPSAEAWLERLHGRGSEDEEALSTRMETAQSELEVVDRFDYVVINSEVEETQRAIRAIIEAERCRQSRRGDEVESLRDSLKRALD